MLYCTFKVQIHRDVKDFSRKLDPIVLSQFLEYVQKQERIDDSTRDANSPEDKPSENINLQDSKSNKAIDKDTKQNVVQKSKMKKSSTAKTIKCSTNKNYCNVLTDDLNQDGD